MHSHSGITSGQGLLELHLPAIDDPHAVESAAIKVPLIMRDDFDAVRGHVSLEVRNRFSQRRCGFGVSQRLRDDPQTKFIIFQSSFEIRNQNIEQVLLGLIEMTEMAAPREVSQRIDSRPPQLAFLRKFHPDYTLTEVSI